MKVMDRVLDQMEARAGACPRRRSKGAGTAVTGTVLLAAAAAGYWQPGILMSGSVSQARGLCSSTAGQLAQAFSASAQADCSHVGAAVTLVVLLALAGFALLLWGLGSARKDGAA